MQIEEGFQGSLALALDDSDELAVPYYSTKQTSIAAPSAISLRDYQVRGVDWMYSLHKKRSNGILADEMGLGKFFSLCMTIRPMTGRLFAGKTLQVIEFFKRLQQKRANHGPHLIVLPLSVITSWRTDLQKFGESTFDLHVHHGYKSDRHEAFGHWHHKLHKLRRRCLETKISLFITTYEIAIRDEYLLSKLTHGNLRWEYLVVRNSLINFDLQCPFYPSLSLALMWNRSMRLTD